MPRVEVLTEVSGRDPEAALTEHVSSETLADEHSTDQLVERTGGALADAERQEQAIHADSASAAAAPARSVRRATARRASNRRATARSRHGESEASIIIDFLAKHPGSTAGDVARGLNLDPGSVSARLTQLAKAGEIEKASHGYNTKP